MSTRVTGPFERTSKTEEQAVRQYSRKHRETGVRSRWLGPMVIASRHDPLRAAPGLHPPTKNIDVTVPLRCGVLGASGQTSSNLEQSSMVFTGHGINGVGAWSVKQAFWTWWFPGTCICMVTWGSSQFKGSYGRASKASKNPVFQVTSQYVHRSM